MPSDSLFSRSNNEGDGPDDPAEGVRIIDPDEAAEAVERGEAVRRKGDDQPKYGDRPAPPPDDVTPALRFPLADSADASTIDRPRVARVEPRQAEGSHEPLISVEPATGETELPHWTEPATGEVPRVVIGEVDDDADEDERWASFAASTPRWRDEHQHWEDQDTTSDLAAAVEDDEGSAFDTIGALDTSERPTHEEYLTFDDLAVPESDAGAPLPARGSSDDPIRITSSQARAPQPPAPRAPSRPSRNRPGQPDAPGGAPARPEGGEGGRDVPQAVFVGVAIAAVAVILFKIGPAATMILAEVVIVLAGVEFFSAVRRGGHRPATLLGLAAVVALPLAVYWRGEGAITLVLFLVVVFSILWFLLGVGGSARPLPNIGVTLLGVVYTGVLGSFAALILDIPVQGVSILFVAVAGAVLYDVGGFFVGRQWGRTPLTEVSPHKTVEGLVGGVIGSLVGTFVFAVLFGIGPFSGGQALVFGLCVAVAAPVGDLAESLFKRDLGLKDMGSILPGHGGILDRFDGLLFALPAAYYAVRFLDLIPGL